MSHKEIIPKNASKVLPNDNPPFNLQDIKQVIPERLFRKSLQKSFYYLGRDLVIVGTLFYLALHIDYLPFSSILWPLYWFWQGTALTGLWVLAHECGHGAFAEEKWINNTVGYIFHTLLLVPYYSWKYTHAGHHIATNDLSRDTVFVPHKRSDYGSTNIDLPNESPLVNLLQMLRMLLFGWPAYLLANAGSQKYESWTSHFFPSSPFFKKTHKWGVLASGVGIIATLVFFGWICFTFSFLAFLKFYGLPYLWTNFWLVSYTLLQHTDRRIPHYQHEEWNFLKGALATIDRDYGVFDFFHHKIGSTHVCHHIFSKIPHYHALEATQYIKKVIGDYYTSTDENHFLSLWKEFTYCKFVEDFGAVRWWKNFEISPNVEKKKK